MLRNVRRQHQATSGPVIEHTSPLIPQPTRCLRRFLRLRRLNRTGWLLVGVSFVAAIALMCLLGYWAWDAGRGALPSYRDTRRDDDRAMWPAGGEQQQEQQPNGAVPLEPQFIFAANNGKGEVSPEQEEALVRSQTYKSFKTTYWAPENRTVPPLRRKMLEAWYAQWRRGDPAADITEEVLTQHAWSRDYGTDDEDLFDMLAFLYPPSQQKLYYRTAMNAILAYGLRVAGTNREALLHHLVEEGLGRRRYNAERHSFHPGASPPPHLSAQGQALLERVAPSWPDAPGLTAEAPAKAESREPGWRWSLLWDNFTTTIPIKLNGCTEASMKNLVFQFPGGSQFRRREAAARTGTSMSVSMGEVPHPLHASTEDPVTLENGKHRSKYESNGTLYEQESFMRIEDDGIPINVRPLLQRGVPGTRVVLSREGNGVSIPLKPSLSASAAGPASQQPMRHLVLAAHWDSKHVPYYPFLGACDSAMPIVFLLRTMKNIAVLTDVAEALTAAYREEREGRGTTAVIPGLTHTFRNATTETEVRERLSSLLSPAHHALLFHYSLARPYTVGGAPVADTPDGMQNHPHQLKVDVRLWLDWVQHLPAMSVLLFDGEEAYVDWKGEDNTYGSRHLAQRWRGIRATTQTRYSGGPQSLFDSIDLFALYDLMGTAGTTFHNMYPTQSGIFYAALAQRESELRRRALRYTTAISAELLWRWHEGGGADDLLHRLLGPTLDAAVATIDQRYIRRLFARAESRPTPAELPPSWLLYGAPGELLTLHHASRDMHAPKLIQRFARLRTYDGIAPGIANRSTFIIENYLDRVNFNIFFSLSQQGYRRRSRSTLVVDDDHKHWLDTQRVLHLIPVPFPSSWHSPDDDGSDIHDGTAVDLAGLLWSMVLESGEYWTST